MKFYHSIKIEVLFDRIASNGKIFACCYKLEKKVNKNITLLSFLEFEVLGLEWYKCYEIMVLRML